MNTEQAAPDWTEALYAGTDGGVSRARIEPPLVRSVRSVRNDGESHTSNSRSATPKPLTCDSDTSNTSNTDTPDLLSAVRNGRWLSEATFPPLQFAVPGILPAGFTVLAGPPKAGKSWLALDWVLSVAAGGRALGQIPVGEPRRVLYFALEDSDRRMQERCNAVLQGSPIPDLYNYQTHINPDLLTATVKAFLGEYPDTGLIVVDTLGRVMPPMKSGETTYQRDYRVGAWLHGIAVAHPGLSVVVCHHTRKTASPDFVDAVSGTNGLAGAADTIIVLSRDRNSNEGLLSVTGRDVEEAEYALTSDQGRWVVDGKDLSESAETAHERKDMDNLGAKSRDIVAFVAGRPEGVRSKEVADKFGQSAYTYLKRLADDGTLSKLERGYYCIPPGAAAA